MSIPEPTPEQKREAAEFLRTLANPSPEQADALPRVAAWLDYDPRREPVQKVVEEIFVHCGASYDLSMVDAFTSQILCAVDVPENDQST